MIGLKNSLWQKVFSYEITLSLNPTCLVSHSIMTISRREQTGNFHLKLLSEYVSDYLSLFLVSNCYLVPLCIGRDGEGGEEHHHHDL